MIIHTVTPGETPDLLARRYGIPLSRLLADNGLRADQSLVVGQALVILFAERTYTVQPGDTPAGIAAATGITTNRLYRNNPALGGVAQLTPGDELVIEWTDTPQATITVNGYAYPFIQQAVLQSTLPYLTELSVFSYGFSADGTLVVPDDQPLLEAAQQYGVAPVMVLTTLSQEGVFRSELAGELLNNPPLQEQVIAAVIDTLVEKGYAGVDVDFEFIPSGNAETFASFVATLATRTRAIGKFTAVALAPKTSADQPGLLYEAHDYAALGAVADHVLLMTYEWGYKYGPPQAVAPLDRVRQVLEFGVSQIPSQKIDIGIPNYGYDWPLPFVQGQTEARTISPTQAVDLARQYRAEIQFDPTAASPFFNYTDDAGIPHVVWFEDARSIAQKLALIPQLGLRGAGYWTVMFPFQPNWSLLNAQYTVQET